MAAVDKIEDQCKPEDLIGHRNRKIWQKQTEYAGVVELADTLDLGSNGQPCRFKSCRPYQKKTLIVIQSESFSTKSTLAGG